MIPHQRQHASGREKSGDAGEEERDLKADPAPTSPEFPHPEAVEPIRHSGEVLLVAWE